MSAVEDHESWWSGPLLQELAYSAIHSQGLSLPHSQALKKIGLPVLFRALDWGRGRMVGGAAKSHPHHVVHACPYHLRVLDLWVQLSPVDVRVAPIHLDICSSGEQLVSAGSTG